jgi:hypothetical protein
MREHRGDDIVLWAIWEPDYLTCNNHIHVIVHVLDDLKSSVEEEAFVRDFMRVLVAVGRAWIPLGAEKTRSRKNA